MYVKRFLCGVEGVRLAGGSEDDDAWAGGVRDLDGSLIVVECVDVISGDRCGGVGWGIVVSKSSDRRRVENVRLASSAAQVQKGLSCSLMGQNVLTFLEMKFPIWNSLFGFRRGCWRCIIVQ